MNKYSTKPVVVKNLFNKEAYNSIIEFMNIVVPSMPKAEDNNEFHRTYMNNVPFFVDIHKQLTDYACELFGEKVKPSYSFLSMYGRGGQCPLHIDRPQCRYTIDYLIRQETQEPWPICIGPQMSDVEKGLVKSAHPTTEEGITEVIDSVDWNVCNLHPNDAVCYSGTNAWHYRPTRSGGSVDLVFFHFVPNNFSGPLN